MKKYSLITAFSMLCAGLVSAQSGSVYAGGNLGVNTQSVKVEATGTTLKSNSWQVAPEVGYFATDDIAVGLMLGIRGDKNSLDTKTTLIQPSLYGRRFFDMNDAFRLFAGLNVGISSDKIEPKNATSANTDKSTGFGAGIDLGGTYKLSDRFTIIGRYATVGLSTTTEKTGSTKTHTSTDFGFNVLSLGPQFTVGIYYTLN